MAKKSQINSVATADKTDEKITQVSSTIKKITKDTDNHGISKDNGDDGIVIVLPGDRIDVARWIVDDKGDVTSATTTKEESGSKMQDNDDDDDDDDNDEDDNDVAAKRKIALGPGLYVESKDGESQLLAVKAGVLRRQRAGRRVWIDGSFRRYIPAVDDFVVGVITQRLAEGYRVDIGGPQQAQLGALSFEGATKRNKPNLSVGAAVLVRVVSADRDLEPEVSCVDSAGRASGLGELKGGTVVRLSLGAARRLLGPRDGVLAAAARAARGFEVAVGLNGRVWVRAETSRDTLVVVHALAALR